MAEDYSRFEYSFIIDDDSKARVLQMLDRTFNDSIADQFMILHGTLYTRTVKNGVISMWKKAVHTQELFHNLLILGLNTGVKNGVNTGTESDSKQQT